MTEHSSTFRARARRSSASVFVLFFLASSILAGCASAPRQIELPAARPLGAELPAYSAPPTVATRSEVEELAGEPEGAIRLSDALAAALLHNPDLAAFSWEIRVGEAHALQAGLLPNPELALEVENVGGSGAFAPPTRRRPPSRSGS